MTIRRLSVAAALLAVAAQTQAQDPRVGLKAGMTDAGVAARGMELVSTTAKPDAFIAKNTGGNMMMDILFANSDMAFKGNQLFVGNFHGFQVFDISNPKAPALKTGFVCPGGQGDVSVHGNLLFMSVEMPNGRTDCATTGALDMNPSKDRFIGVRIFDISDISKPQQVAAVQTCRGSHTHTLVTDPKDPAHVYVYVAGTSAVRSAQELPGCVMAGPDNPNTSLFRIEIIKVNLANPQAAAIVNMPRIFATGDRIAGLWPGGAHGEGTQQTARTDQCHDLTAYSAIGLVAGACSGNGILLDISDPTNPKRIAEVSDPNFAYWHSATFNNDGSKVLFTDEWGGGMAARCQATDKPTWGADAIFELSADRKLKHVGYYKLPAPQSAQENCVAHNGSLVPVPGRDIMVQGWYQGGISVFDFTDPAKPFELAYFDRGAYNPTQLTLGGVWSAYWYNGNIYSTEIGRGLDILALTPTEHLTQNEIDAAKLVRMDVFNPQNQTKLTWPAHFTVARAYVDQLKRNSMMASMLGNLPAELDAAERSSGTARRDALNRIASGLAGHAAHASGADVKRVNALVETLKALASQR